MTQQQMKQRGMLYIFASYYKPHWKLFALDMACALVICVIDLTFSLVSRMSMQQLLPAQAYRAFFVVMALMAAAYVLKGGMYFIVTYWGHLLGVHIEADIRADLFSHMQRLSFSFYNKMVRTRNSISLYPELIAIYLLQDELSLFLISHL